MNGDETGTSIRYQAETNCTQLLLDFMCDIALYQKAVIDTGYSDEIVIIVSDYEDLNGREIADYMIETEKLETILDEGYTPVAIGTMSKEEILQRLDFFDPMAAAELRTMKRLAIVAISDEIAIIHDIIF